MLMICLTSTNRWVTRFFLIWKITPVCQKWHISIYPYMGQNGGTRSGQDLLYVEPRPLIQIHWKSIRIHWKWTWIHYKFIRMRRRHRAWNPSSLLRWACTSQKVAKPYWSFESTNAWKKASFCFRERFAWLHACLSLRNSALARPIRLESSESALPSLVMRPPR